MKIFNTDSVLRLLIIFLMFALIACEKEESFDPEQLKKPLTQLNLSYGKTEVQKMDVYLPADRNRNQTQVMLLLHGGAWATGAKEEMDEIIPKLQQAFGNEYAIVNMNYRLVNFLGVYMLPTQIDDIEQAMSFVESKSVNWGVKPQFVSVGVSAGGHLALLHAYRFDNKNRVKAVVNVVGPTDLTDPFYQSHPLFSQGLNYIMRSKDIPDGMTAPQFASSVTWIAAQSPPTISFYGNRDHLIPNNQGEKLESTLEQYKVRREMHIYDGGHDIAEKFSDDIVSKTKMFLDQVK